MYLRCTIEDGCVPTQLLVIAIVVDCVITASHSPRGMLIHMARQALYVYQVHMHYIHKTGCDYDLGILMNLLLVLDS